MSASRCEVLAAPGRWPDAKERERRALAAAAAWEGWASARGPAAAALRKGLLTGRTRARLAELYAASPQGVQRARALLQRDPTGVERVRRGEISLTRAYRELRERERRYGA